MGKIINVSIDVAKLDKTKFFEGKKGTYVNVTVAENRNGVDDYGNTHYVFQSQSKEDREAGNGKNYLGNGKEFVFGGTPVLETATDDDFPI